jgi:hypothetical protein
VGISTEGREIIAQETLPWEKLIFKMHNAIMPNKYWELKRQIVLTSWG